MFSEPIPATRFSEISDDLLATPAEAPSMLWLVGMDVNGDGVWDSRFNDPTPHLLASSSRSDDLTDLVGSMVVQVCSANTPKQLQLEFLDMTGNLAAFAESPLTITYGGGTVADARKWLRAREDELRARSLQLASTEHARLIDQWGNDSNSDPLPIRVVIINDMEQLILNDLQASKHLQTVAEFGRYAGFHIVLLSGSAVLPVSWESGHLFRHCAGRALNSERSGSIGDGADLAAIPDGPHFLYRRLGEGWVGARVPDMDEAQGWGPRID